MESYLIYSFKYLRISWKKLNKITRSIKGVNLNTVQKTLSFIYNKQSVMLLKLLKNCLLSILDKNANVGIDDIDVVNFITNKGPVLKRFRFVSKGSTRLIKKKFSHLRIIFNIRNSK